ncbi:MAG: hypothetical protein ACYTEL_12905 [Planctomycetota bacterium]
MSKRLLALAVVVLLSWVCKQQAYAVYDANWIGGESGNWDSGDNWYCKWWSSFPQNTGVIHFDVTIPKPPFWQEETRVYLYNSRTVDTLELRNTVELKSDPSRTGIRLVLEVGALTNLDELTIERIDIEPMGTVSDVELRDPDDGLAWVNLLNYGTLQFQGAGIDVHDNVGNMGSLEATAGTQLDIDGYLINNGTLTVVPSAVLTVEEYLYNTGQIMMYGDLCGTEGQFLNDSTGVISGLGILYGKQLLENKGTISALGGLLAISVVEGGPMMNSGLLANRPLATLNVVHTSQAGNVTVDNHGTIEVNAGGGVAFDCNLVNDSEPNGTINLYGGTLAAPTITQTTDANFAGFGTIAGDLFLERGDIVVFSGGYLMGGGLVHLTGPTNIVGDVNIAPGAILEISDGQTLITGHTVCDGTIRLIGGTVVFQGGCDCDGCDITHGVGAERNHFDVNGDGIVNFLDYAYFADHWLWRSSWY